MPTSTFFNLNQEKRERIITASQNEFARVPYDEVLIKNIIDEAKIPRGSFYQYFIDKEDLFTFLLLRIKNFLDEQLTLGPKDDVDNIFDMISTHVGGELLFLISLPKSGNEVSLLRHISESQMASSIFNSLLDDIYSRNPLFRKLLHDPRLGIKTNTELQALLELLISAGKSAIFSVLRGESNHNDALELLNEKIQILKNSYFPN